MKIIALGDTHGRPYWKTIVETEDFDKIVFIGDYFDSREFILLKQQKQNFREIIAFKKFNPSKVILLFGNHDYHYLPDVDEKYSNYQPSGAKEIGRLLTDAISEDLMQMCFLYKTYLFTHAGVTRTWAGANGLREDSIDRSINQLFLSCPTAFAFTPGENDSPSGDDITQSPIWVRPQSLMEDQVDGYIQVVGHTQQEELCCKERIILIDTLGTSGQYLKIDGQAVSVSQGLL